MQKYYKVMINKRQNSDYAIFKKPIAQKLKFLLKFQQQNVKLPNIYLRSNSVKLNKLLPLDDVRLIRKQLSKAVSFKKQKLSCLSAQMLSKLPQQIKSIPYSSFTYEQNLQIVNKIFQACDFTLKAKDIIVAQGQKSHSYYIFFTNYAHHPQSLCCSSPIFIQSLNQNLLQNYQYRLICLECKAQILKFGSGSGERVNATEEQRKRNGLEMMIASGRYKKYRLNAESLSMSKSKIQLSQQSIQSRLGSHSVLSEYKKSLI